MRTQNAEYLDYLLIIFYVVVAVQVIYFITFLFGFDKDRITKGSASVNVTHEPVSVLICAHDEEENLRELLPLLENQQYPDFEVIVVNDRSNDGTYDFLREITANDSRIKLVDVKHKPEHLNAKKYAITLGIKAASNEWILLTDADCRPSSQHWIMNMSAKFEDSKQLVIGFSPYEKHKGFLNLFIRFETLLTGIMYVAFAALGRPYMGVGRNLAYRKSLFLDTKGFSKVQDVTGGDDDLFVNQHATSMNTAICVGKDSLMFSKPKTTLSSFIQQKIRHLSVGKRYKGLDKFLLGMFSLTHILTWVIAIALMIIMPDFYWVEVLIVVRITLFSATVAVASERLGDKFESWLVPVLDFVFAIYYISTAPVALFTKKIRWTN